MIMYNETPQKATWTQRLEIKIYNKQVSLNIYHFFYICARVSVNPRVAMRAGNAPVGWLLPTASSSGNCYQYCRPMTCRCNCSTFNEGATLCQNRESFAFDGDKRCGPIEVETAEQNLYRCTNVLYVYGWLVYPYLIINGHARCPAASIRYDTVSICSEYFYICMLQKWEQIFVSDILWWGKKQPNLTNVMNHAKRLRSSQLLSTGGDDDNRNNDTDDNAEL